MPAYTPVTRATVRQNNVAFRDATYSPAEGSSLWELVPQLAALDPRVAFVKRDDFFTYDDTATVGDYAEVSDGGAIATTDAVGGELSIATLATDNAESYVSTLHECWKAADGKHIFWEVGLTLTEANTDDANIIVGLSDTVGANTLLDNGGGPAASYDGVVFFKVDGGTVWQFETSNATTQQTTANAGAFSDATKTWLGAVCDMNDGTTAKVTPYIDGVAGTTLDWTIAGLEEMHFLLGVKAGDTNAETLLVDTYQILQIR